MNFKFLIVIALLVGCSHVDKTHDEVAQNLLNNLRDKNITVVAPSSCCSSSEMQKIEKYISYNQNIILIKFPDDDHTKAMLLKHALLSNESDIIWALRGGYGTAKVIEILYNDANFMSEMRTRKYHSLFIGYSDITALHLFLSQEFGLKTIHGNVFYEIFTNDKNREENFTALDKLINGVRKITINSLEPINEIAKQPIEISGKLTGGNLSIIQTSIGTKWQINTKDKILFLEDCHEKPYRIDRMLHHLKSAGIFDSVKAIIFGSLCDTTKQMDKWIAGFSMSIQVPIYKTHAFGNSTYNYPIVYNSDVTIQVNKDNISLTQNF